VAVLTIVKTTITR